jgi:hypothetical protein
MAHPSRSNPAARSIADKLFPCITPSTETCVVVVSFTIAPLLLSFRDPTPLCSTYGDPATKPQAFLGSGIAAGTRRLTSALDPDAKES